MDHHTLPIIYFSKLHFYEFYYMYVCAFGYVQMHEGATGSQKTLVLPECVVTGNCEQPSAGAGNQASEPSLELLAYLFLRQSLDQRLALNSLFPPSKCWDCKCAIWVSHKLGEHSTVSHILTLAYSICLVSSCLV